MYVHNENSNPINQKLELLRDFCILKTNAYKQEEAIREILGACKSEMEMDRKLRDLLIGDKSLKEFIKQYRGNN